MALRWRRAAAQLLTLPILWDLCGIKDVQAVSLV